MILQFTVFRASPAVLIIRSCTVKLDEEMSILAGLAQENSEPTTTPVSWQKPRSFLGCF